MVKMLVNTTAMTRVLLTVRSTFAWAPGAEGRAAGRSSFAGSESLLKPGAAKWALPDSGAAGGKLIPLQLEGVLFTLWWLSGSCIH